jgi:hypothetical protein
MPYDPRKMAGQLIRKLGAVEEAGSRHMHYKVYYENQLVGSTLISHGVSEIDDGIASAMAKQLCITLGVLDGIYRCPYGWEEYRENHDTNRNPRIPYRVRWN